VPMSKAFIYWAGTKAADMALSHFVPVYGQIDTVNDVAGYLAWLSNSNPVYIRVRSDFTVICQNDGSSSLVVREGHPAVVTEQTGFAGIQAASGETAVISATNQISVTVSSAAQTRRADEILGAMLDGSSDPAGLEPVELDAPLPRASHTGGGTAGYENEPGYQDEAGDVPMGWPMAYSFDEFIMGFWDDWDYTPETEHTYASLSKDDIPLYIVIVRDQVSSAVLLEVLEMDCGEPIELEVGNRDAHFYPLVENGAEFGCMLSFDDPLANGNRLHVVFLSDSNYLDEVSDLIIEIMSGMSFSR